MDHRSFRVKMLPKFPVAGQTKAGEAAGYREAAVGWKLGNLWGGSRNDPQWLDSWMVYSENPKMENY